MVNWENENLEILVLIIFYFKDLVGSSNPWELHIAPPSDGWLYRTREGHSGTTQIPHFDWTGYIVLDKASYSF